VNSSMAISGPIVGLKKEGHQKMSKVMKGKKYKKVGGPEFWQRKTERWGGGG